MKLPAPEDLNLSKKGAVLVGTPIVIETIFLLIMYAMLLGANEQAKSEAYTKSVLFHQQMVDSLLAEAVSHSYNTVLNSSTIEHNTIADIKRDMDEEFRVLGELVKTDTGLMKRLERMKFSLSKGMSIASEVEAGRLSNEFVPIQIQKMVSQLRQLYRDEYDQRKAFAADLQAKQKSALFTSDQWKLILAGTLSLWLIINIGMIIVLVRFFGRAMSDRLRVLVDNSIRLAAGQPLHQRLAGHDEIATLDNVFHNMARELKIAQRKEKAIADNSVDVICSVDQSSRFTATNQASLDVWKYHPDELLGRHLADIVFKEDIDSTRQVLQLCQQSESERSFENRVRNKDGHLVDMLWSVTWSRQRKTYFCVAHDITERRRQEELLLESEKRLRLILQSMPVGVVIGSENGRIASINNKMEEMFGYRDEDLSGQSLRLLFPGVSGASDEDFIDHLQETSSAGSIELDGCRKDGSSFPAQLAVSHFFMQGELKPLIVIADITSRREVERMKQELVSMVSHDLKTPLTTLVIVFQLLKNGTLGQLNEKGKLRVSSLEQEVARLMSLIGNLLDLDKVEASGGVTIRKEVMSFEAIILQSLMSVGYLAEKNGIQLASTVTPCEAFADSAGLVQVVVNLLANAIKFSPSGSTISVSAEPVEGGVRVSIQDQGRGIPSEKLTTIFDRFKQVENKDRSEKMGSGLGLAICKSIVEGHGGKIGVTSTEGHGSTFWFFIPVED